MMIYIHIFYELIEADVELIPSMEMTPANEHELKMLIKLIETLEENDDVQKVYHNCSVPLDAE